MAFNFDPKQTAAPPFGSRAEEPTEPMPKKKKKLTPKAPPSMRGLEQATMGPKIAPSEPY